MGDVRIYTPASRRAIFCTVPSAHCATRGPIWTIPTTYTQGFPGGSLVKKLPAMQETQV